MTTPSLSVLAVLSIAGAAMAQPRFNVVGGLERSYGRVPLHRQIRDTLTITNSGTGILRIIGINPTCGCTAAIIDTNAIPAGSAAHVYVTIEPPDAMEKTHKTIVFLTNDLAHPATEVGLGFEILRDLGSVPRQFAFAACRIHKPCDVAVTLHNLSDASIDVFRQPITVPGLKCLMPDTVTVAAHDSLPYRLQLTADTTGLLQGRFLLRTTSARNPEIEFPVIANVADEHGVPVIRTH